MSIWKQKSYEHHIKIQYFINFFLLFAMIWSLTVLSFFYLKPNIIWYDFPKSFFEWYVNNYNSELQDDDDSIELNQWRPMMEIRQKLTIPQRKQKDNCKFCFKLFQRSYMQRHIKKMHSKKLWFHQGEALYF